MHHGVNHTITRALALATALVAALGCEEFREFPTIDATVDHADADVPRPDVARPDVSVAPDASEASDVSTAPFDAGPCGGACASGQICCDDRCVDPMTDPGNCGGCAVTCDAPNASSTCQRGACTILCRPGFGDCDANPLNGCEVPLSSSAFNCGGCGQSCSTSHATPTCDTGRCLITCDQGWGNCDGDVRNGCEANLQTSLDHCNGCENPCRTNHNNPFCDGPAACVRGDCEVGWADCNGDRRDGCETHIDGDVSNCGACRNVCTAGPGATPTCAAGRCGEATVICADPRGECDGVVAPPSAQCETDLRNNAAHCGRCGNACSTVNATPACVDRACVLTCNAGYGNCDSIVANGCETNTNTSASNCGACGRACSLPHTTAYACAMGACAPVTCEAGFGNCDGIASNGCETDTRSTPTACGGCGTACSVPNGAAACASSLCAVSRCNTGFANCDSNAANGCETNTTTDVRNCGACGTACAFPYATPTCAAGRCAPGACYSGFSNCDGNPTNGCEASVANDPRDCGACGTICSFSNGAPACAAGRCVLAGCVGGFSNCDGNPTNGCEINILNDPRNCGGCGHNCVILRCVNGVCVP